MVFATLVEPTEASMFGIKSKILDSFSRHTLEKSLLSHALKVFSYPLVKMIWFQYSLVTRVNTNS